jgi:hypothetical protein
VVVALVDAWLPIHACTTALVWERRIGHPFRLELPLASVQEALARGEQPGPVQDWVR